MEPRENRSAGKGPRAGEPHARRGADSGRERQARAIKLGALLGFCAAMLAANVVLWGWAVPATDEAVGIAVRAAGL